MSSHLYQVLASKVKEWKEAGYPCEEYPAISEILEFQINQETKSPVFLRSPQINALETYWYLRLIEKTPHVFELYKRYFTRARELRESLGLTDDLIRDYVEDYGIEALWERIKTDDEFVRNFKLESVRETISLNYASYILALAMGAGKTILIGAIIATEFGMAFEYPEGPFVQNALVFAPGKTIIESLREISQVPYNKILPKRLFKPFAANVKITFTRDGDKYIPVISGSIFNIVITNTEKIRIQAVNKREDRNSLFFNRNEAATKETVNLRLKAIASLPHLAIFSDEAHHTYGQSLLGKWETDRETGERVFKETGIKKVRKTVDYLSQNTNLICVVNTTGTPYFERQPLRDAVIWYGLSEGIKDGILKEVAGNIQAYGFDNTNADKFVSEVIKDFFRDYKNVCLPDGSLAKIAIYFPQKDDLVSLRPYIEASLIEMGLSPSIVLENTSDSSQEEIDRFNRLNEPNSTHRVILLVNKGTEGWNCPSLFACALARKLKTSNNFVLQAATRCLRQVPGNNYKAKIYLSMDNRAILDRQLQETYGETITDLNNAGRETATTIIRIRKPNIDPIIIEQSTRVVKRKDIDKENNQSLTLTKPKSSNKEVLTKSVFTLTHQQATKQVLKQVGDALVIDSIEDSIDINLATVKISNLYRLDYWLIKNELIKLYGENGNIPTVHLDILSKQIEEQISHYEVVEEKVNVELEIIKTEGFTKESEEVYTTNIVYLKDREKLLLHVTDINDNIGEYGFHYSPYNFDSNPEKSFFEQILSQINLNSNVIQDIYFTGALTDPNKTDFYVDYRDTKGKWRRYTPDFIVRKVANESSKGKCYIVEIKAERDRHDPINGENGKKALAIRNWEVLNQNDIQYEMIFTETDVVSFEKTKAVREFIEGDVPNDN